MNETTYELVVCIINAGFSQIVMEAARAAGAKGGTILRARGTANPESEEFFNIPVQPDKEMVMILVPKEHEDLFVVSRLSDLLRGAGFRSMTITTADKHDEMIAFTSQLAHVVSNAYIKSPTATEHLSYSAGSYRDLTRVARLNETMWTELFLDNADHLGFELDCLIHSLQEYRDAIAAGDAETLCRLLKEGRERKESIDTE